jgi:hypothetical protein
MVLAEREARLAQRLLTQGLQEQALRLQMQLTLRELERQFHPQLPLPEESLLPELHFPTEEQPPPPPAAQQVWEALRHPTSSPASES